MWVNKEKDDWRQARIIFFNKEHKLIVTAC